MKCVCDTTLLLNGNAADDYSRDHLIEDFVDVNNWIVLFHCPVTHKEWLMDYPQGDLQGGGPPRLRQVDSVGRPISGTDAAQ